MPRYEYNLRPCTTCGRELRPLKRDGTYPKHYHIGRGGRRELCLNSGRNALTAAELGTPKSAYRL